MVGILRAKGEDPQTARKMARFTEKSTLIPSSWWIISVLCTVLLIVLDVRVRRLCQPD